MKESISYSVFFGKKILLGVSGSIAAYKIPELVRMFKKKGAEVKVLLTQDASAFVSPLTLSTLSENDVKKLPTVCGSLREAMQNLDKDRKFLTEGGVFTDDQIDAYIELKFQEIYNFEHTPHPIEFEMYYSG